MTNFLRKCNQNLYRKWEESHSQEMDMNLLFSHDAIIICNTLTTCARSSDEKHSVKISSKSIKKYGRICLHKEWSLERTDAGTYGWTDGKDDAKTDKSQKFNVKRIVWTLTLYSIDTHLMHQQLIYFKNIVEKGEIAHYKQFLLFSQCFLLNQINVFPFVHIFDIISVFSAELEEPKIGM